MWKFVILVLMVVNVLTTPQWKDGIILTGSEVATAVIDNLSNSEKVQFVVENGEGVCIFNGTAGDPTDELVREGSCYLHPNGEWETKVTKLDNGTDRVTLLPSKNIATPDNDNGGI